MTSPKPKSTKITKITPGVMTLEEFRSYLKGIMFVGGKNWVPTAQQWADIVQIIDQLDTSPKVAAPRQPTTYPGVTQPTWLPAPVQQYESISKSTSRLDQPTGDQAVEFPSFV
jgi:hypothetical protein